MSNSPSNVGPDGFIPRWVSLLYRWRWPLTGAVVGLAVLALASGMDRVMTFSVRVDSFKDTPPEQTQPKVLDSRTDIWFDPDDEGLQLWQTLEKQFVADDTVLVAFEAADDPWGAFGPEALAATERMTSAMEKIPFVRNVRSLTSNPWIRWGEIEPGDPGLLVTDLFDRPAATFSESERLERMVAVLGAGPAAAIAGEAPVRALLGPEANFRDHIGEPRLLGALVSEDARTAAIAVQVLRPQITPEELEERFGSDLAGRQVAPNLHANESQWLTLRGIERVLGMERGLVVPTDEFRALIDGVSAIADEEERARVEREIADVSLDAVRLTDGQYLQKYRTYELQGSDYVDISDPSEAIAAPDFQPQPRSPYAFHTAGLPRFEKNFTDVGMADMAYVGVMFGVIALVLLVLYRRLSGMVLPLMVMNLAIFGMVGLVWWAGDLLNNLTATAPNIVTAISIANVVHFLSAYFRLRPKHDNRHDLIIDVLHHNALPVFLASFTTAAGFFSLTVSSITPMRMLGYTGGIGAILAYLLTVTLVPALLSLLPLPKRDAKQGRTEQTDASKPTASHWSDPLVDLLVRRRTLIVVASVGVLALGLLGLSRIEIDSNFTNMFPDSNPVMKDIDWIEARLGGSGDLELVFFGPEFALDDADVGEKRSAFEELEAKRLLAESGEGPAWAEPDVSSHRALQAALEDHDRRRIAVREEFLKEVDRFESRLVRESQDPDSPLRMVTKFESGLDVLRKMHQVQNANSGEFYRVPASVDVPAEAAKPTVEYDDIAEEALVIPAQSASTMAAQYYIQYENGAKPSENLSRLITADRRGFRLNARLRQGRSREMLAAFDRIREIAREEFPLIAGAATDVESGQALSTLTLSGKLYLFANMIDRFTRSLMVSLSLALLVISLLIAFIYRSLVLGLVSLIPNVLPLIIPLAAMGLLGIPLDGPAVIVVSVALGICVDDTIHFLTRFSNARKAGLSTEGALSASFREVGNALTYTTIVLMLGFGMLMLSDFRPNYLIGQLALVMIALAWVADFVVTPAVLSLFTRSEAPSTPGTLAPSGAAGVTHA